MVVQPVFPEELRVSGKRPTVKDLILYAENSDMNNIAIIIIVVCLLFFISGCLLGSAMISSKLNELKNRLKKTGLLADQLREEIDWLKKTNDEVLADYRNLYTYYNDLRRQSFAQQNTIIALKAEARQLRKKPIPPDTESEISSLKEEIASLEKDVTIYKKFGAFYQKYLDQISVENDLRFQIQQLKDQLSISNKESLANVEDIRRYPLVASVCETTENISQMFDSIIQFFSSQIFERGCVISDTMGFVVASSCEDSEEIAAISVLFEQCEEIIKRNSSFNSLARLCFINQDKLHLTVFPLLLDNGLRVFCSGLSCNSFPKESELNTMILPIKNVEIQRSL